MDLGKDIEKGLAFIKDKAIKRLAMEADSELATFKDITMCKLSREIVKEGRYVNYECFLNGLLGLKEQIKKVKAERSSLADLLTDAGVYALLMGSYDHALSNLKTRDEEKSR